MGMPEHIVIVGGGTAGWIAALMMQSDPGGAKAHNAAHARQIDDFRDFIRLHYVRERRDTAFWRDVTDSHPAAVTDRVA